MSDAAMITSLDEFEEEYRKGIGRPLAQRWTTAASLDNIRRWGDGVGDYNPLWRDPDYAAGSRYRMVTAPPTFMYAVSLGVRAAEDGAIDPARLSTTHFPMNYAGGEIVFHRTIWRGDVLTAQEEVGPIVRKHSERIGPFVINTGLVQYYNQRQELVASKSTRMARYHNLGSGATIEYDREPRRAGAGEPADPLVWERARRGAEPRYWEDVSVGDKLPILPKGTYSVSELFLFTHGVMGTYRTTRAALEKEGSAELGGGGRFDLEHATERRNMPGQFDYGPQRVCWMAQIVTDWMGRRRHAAAHAQPDPPPQRRGRHQLGERRGRQDVRRGRQAPGRRRRVGRESVRAAHRHEPGHRRVALARVAPRGRQGRSIACPAVARASR